MSNDVNRAADETRESVEEAEQQEFPREEESGPRENEPGPDDASPDERGADEEGLTEETGESSTPESEVEKWKDVAVRSRAELENFRKRMAREKSDAILYANRSLLEQLLPIIDNFEMGLKAAENSEGSSSMILQGMGMVRKQLEDFLSDQGVEVIESDGIPFNPNVHEAIKQEPSEEVPEGVVLYTIRRGYRLKERILRAANVVVSAGPAENSEEPA